MFNNSGYTSKFSSFEAYFLLSTYQLLKNNGDKPIHYIKDRLVDQIENETNATAKNEFGVEHFQVRLV